MRDLKGFEGVERILRDFKVYFRDFDGIKGIFRDFNAF